MTKGLQLVIFRIGKELFGVGIDTIREIVRVPEISEIPDSPDFLEGMINLRGRIVPVIDMRKRLRLSVGDLTKASRVLVMEDEGKMAGLIVDSVDEVIRIEKSEVDDPPDMIGAVGVEYITGVAKVDERLIIMLDLKKILSPDEVNKYVNEDEQTGELQGV